MATFGAALMLTLPSRTGRTAGIAYSGIGRLESRRATTMFPHCTHEIQHASSATDEFQVGQLIGGDALDPVIRGGHSGRDNWDR